MNETTLWTNHEIILSGVRVRAGILKNVEKVTLLNQTITTLNEKLAACQWRMSRLNETSMEQSKEIQRMKEELDYLAVECFGKNRLLPDICSGHGECVDVDHCQCGDEWTGDECEIRRFEWLQVDVLSIPERYFFSGVLYDEKLWILGGFDGVERYSDLSEFSFSDSTWKQQPGISDVRHHHTAVVYLDQMWVFGGRNASAYFNDVLMFSFTKMNWVEIPVDNAADKRIAHSGVLYQDSMWIYGGRLVDALGPYANDLWEFDFAEFSWEKMNPASSPNERLGHSAVIYQDAMWTFGGIVDYGRISDVWKYDFTLSSWEEITNSTISPIGRNFHDATVYQDKMWIFAGRHSEVLWLNDLWTFNFSDYSWHEVSTVSTSPSVRFGHVGVVYRDELWIFGGSNGTSSFNDLWKLVL